MPHRRHRKFNTREWYRGTQAHACDFCMTVEADGHIFLRGQTGRDFEGDFHGFDDPAAQAEKAMEKVKILLEEAGARLEHICEVTVYVTDRAHLEPVCGVIGRHLAGVYPAQSEIIVKGLARPYMQMEVDVRAIVPAAARDAA